MAAATDPSSSSSVARVNVKYGGKIVLDEPLDPARTLGQFRTDVQSQLGILPGKMTLIYRGKKLQGIGWPDDLPLSEVVGAAFTSGTALFQALGPPDPNSALFAEIEGKLDAYDRGDEVGEPVDMLTLSDWSTKLDNLEGLEGRRGKERRKLLYQRLERVEKGLEGRS